MANTAYQFLSNMRGEIMNPMHLAYDVGFGVLGTVLIDATGFDNAIGSVADAVNLSPQRTGQLGAGLTFATLNAMERATMHTLRIAY